jgi:hypothetical protein
MIVPLSSPWVKQDTAFTDCHVARCRFSPAPEIRPTFHLPEKDRQDRQAILEKLEAQLASGGVKKLISNRGYRRFLKVTKGAAQIDAARVKEDERYDGKYVLRTSTDLPAWEVAEAYKQTLAGLTCCPGGCPVRFPSGS